MNPFQLKFLEDMTTTYQTANNDLLNFEKGFQSVIEYLKTRICDNYEDDEEENYFTGFHLIITSVMNVVESEEPAINNHKSALIGTQIGVDIKKIHPLGPPKYGAAFVFGSVSRDVTKGGVSRTEQYDIALWAYVGPIPCINWYHIGHSLHLTLGYTYMDSAKKVIPLSTNNKDFGETIGYYRIGDTPHRKEFGGIKPFEPIPRLTLGLPIPFSVNKFPKTFTKEFVETHHGIEGRLKLEWEEINKGFGYIFKTYMYGKKKDGIRHVRSLKFHDPRTAILSSLNVYITIHIRNPKKKTVKLKVEHKGESRNFVRKEYNNIKGYLRIWDNEDYPIKDQQRWFEESTVYEFSQAKSHNGSKEIEFNQENIQVILTWDLEFNIGDVIENQLEYSSDYMSEFKITFSGASPY